MKLQGIAHYVYPRFTRLINTTGQDWKINEAYAAVRGSDVRNRQIISDIEECLRQGTTPLVLTKFRDHADILLAMLRDKADHVFLLKGGRSRKENEQIRENMKNVPANESMVLVAIGQYIGEGFNYPRLDTMMLTTPIAWQGNVEQYSGRLHRNYEGKRKVIIYDYVDAHIRVLDKMYYKRLRAYKKIGYEIVMNEAEKKQETNAIFDSESYTSVFERDVAQADTEIVISSPGIGAKGVHRILKTLEERHDSGVKITLLTLSADNAQAEQTTGGLPNPLTESVRISGGQTLTVGEDFPAGVYDLSAVSGYGAPEITICDQEGNELQTLYPWLTDSSETESIYRNVVLPQGAVFSNTDEELELELVPSETIVSEDYLGYYDRY